MATRERVRVPRAIHIGSRPRTAPGAELSVLVLVEHGPEWFGVDLETGAFLRVIGTAHLPPPTGRNYRVVGVSVAGEVSSIDPARPELVVAEPVVRDMGSVRPRRLRRLFSLVAAADRPGATVLGTRGPSVAYVDLDGSAASVTMLDARRAALELLIDRDIPQLAITFGGVTQRFPVLDGRVVDVARRVYPRSLSGQSLAAEIGFRPGYVVIGLGEVDGGHVRKFVYALIPRAKG